jgi:hypothetical protein
MGHRCPATGPCRARRPARRPRLLVGAGRGHHPPHPGPPGSRGAGRRHRRLADRPQPQAQPAPTRCRGGWQDPARRRRDGRQVHLLAAMDHATRAVVAQRQVDGAPGEVPGLQPLLADLDLAGTVVTADALHTHRDAAEFLVVAKRRTTCWPSRPTSPPCSSAAGSSPGIVFPCWTAPATRPTAASSCAPSRPSPCTTSGSRTPRRSSRSPQASCPAHPAVADRAGVRDHQPHLRPGQPCPACRPPAGPLGDREQPALGPGCDLRRGWLPDPHRDCPAGHGLPAQPGHRRAQPGRPVKLAAALRHHSRDPCRPLATLGISLR